jgi:hypothetical protein
MASLAYKWGCCPSLGKDCEFAAMWTSEKEELKYSKQEKPAEQTQEDIGFSYHK